MKTAPVTPPEVWRQFKPGHKITLNTGYACDAGVFVRMEDNKVVWQDRHGHTYKSPVDEYNITLR